MIQAGKFLELQAHGNEELEKCFEPLHQLQPLVTDLASYSLLASVPEIRGTCYILWQENKDGDSRVRCFVWIFI